LDAWIAFIVSESLIACDAGTVLRHGVERGAASHGVCTGRKRHARCSTRADSAAGIFGIALFPVNGPDEHESQRTTPTFGKQFNGQPRDAVGTIHEPQRASTQEGQSR